MQEWVEEEEISVDLKNETGKFMDFHRGRATKSYDWVADWRLWIRRGADYQVDHSNSSGQKTKHWSFDQANRFALANREIKRTEESVDKFIARMQELGQGTS